MDKQSALPEPMSPVNRHPHTRFSALLVNHPPLVRFLEAALWRIRCAGLVAGTIAVALNQILSIVGSMSGDAASTFEQLYHGLPTWLIFILR